MEHIIPRELHGRLGIVRLLGSLCQRYVWPLFICHMKDLAGEARVVHVLTAAAFQIRTREKCAFCDSFPYRTRKPGLHMMHDFALAH